MKASPALHRVQHQESIRHGTAMALLHLLPLNLVSVARVSRILLLVSLHICTLSQPATISIGGCIDFRGLRVVLLFLSCRQSALTSTLRLRFRTGSSHATTKKSKKVRHLLTFTIDIFLNYKFLRIIYQTENLKLQWMSVNSHFCLTSGLASSVRLILLRSSCFSSRRSLTFYCRSQTARFLAASSQSNKLSMSLCVSISSFLIKIGCH